MFHDDHDRFVHFRLIRKIVHPLQENVPMQNELFQLKLVHHCFSNLDQVQITYDHIRIGLKIGVGSPN